MSELSANNNYVDYVCMNHVTVYAMYVWTYVTVCVSVCHSICDYVHLWA